MEFIVTDGKLTIEKNVIRKKLLVTKENYAWLHFIMLVLFLAYTLYIVKNAFETGDNSDKIRFLWIPIIIVWLYPHLKKIFEWIFIKTWKSAITLSKVKDVKVIPQENTLETKVVLTLSSGREKFYTFRNAENQVERFVEVVNVGMVSLTLVPSP